MEEQVATVAKLWEKYEFKWTISNWSEIQTSTELIGRQNIILETGLSYVKAQWVFGLRPDIGSKKKCANITITLNKLYGTTEPLEGYVSTLIETKSRQTNIYGNSTDWFRLGQTLEQRSDKLPIYEKMFGKSSITFLITLEVCLTKYPVISINPPAPKITPVFTKLNQSVSTCMKTLLDDKESADINMMTSDSEIIFAHTLILKAQCPALDNFIQSELLKNLSKTVTLHEVSGKTLKLFLEYWYTGKLSEICFNKDVIVEFTKFAGKFKMITILEMLDSYLGKIEETLNYSHVQLLDMTDYLELKNATANLLKRIIGAVNQIKTGTELFKIFHQDEQMVSAHVENTNVLQIMNKLVDQQDATHKDVLLLAAVERQGLNKLEALILKCVVKATNKIENPDDLFKLFGYTRQYIREKEEDLLVRKLPDSPT